jgi:ABC-type lipoprotein release transport system permease subunit
MWLAGFKIAIKNLRRNTKRNVATLTTILFGTAGIILFAGYYARANSFLQAISIYLDHVGDVAVFPKGGLSGHLSKPGKYTFSPESVALINETVKHDDRVSSIHRILHGTAMASNGCFSVPVIFTGVEIAAEKMVRTSEFTLRNAQEFVPPIKGKQLWESTLHGDSNAIILSEELAQKLDKRRVLDEIDISQSPTVGNTQIDCTSKHELKAMLSKDANIQIAAMTLDGRFSAIDGEIIGWKKAARTWTTDTEMLVSIESAQKLLDTDKVTSLEIFLKNRGDATEIASLLRNQLMKMNLPADVYTFQDESLNSFYVGNISVLTTMAVFFLILITFASLVSTTGSVVMTVLERAKEIGFMRAMGYTPKDICILTVQENLFVSLTGIILGVVAALLCAAALSFANLRLAPPGLVGDVHFTLLIDFWMILAAGLFLLTVSMISCTVSVLRFARKDLTELLTQTTH